MPPGGSPQRPLPSLPPRCCMLAPLPCVYLTSAPRWPLGGQGFLATRVLGMDPNPLQRAPLPIPAWRPKVPMGRRLHRGKGPEGPQGTLGEAPFVPGSWEADSRCAASVFSAAVPELYLDRLYLQYTCFRLVFLEAGMETGQSRSSPCAPHVCRRRTLSAV